MKASGTYVFWAAYFLAAALCQVLAGDFPETLFGFPANAAVMLLWAVGLMVLFKEKRSSRLVSMLLSKQSTFVLIGAFAATCLIQGFSAERLSGTWWFIAAAFAFLSHLFLVLLRGMQMKRPHKLRFFLNHAGLLAALAGGFFGSPDAMEWKALAQPGTPVREAVADDGSLVPAEYRLQLDSLEINSYDNGVPKDFRAFLTDETGRDIALRVNHPFRLSWQDDLYLSGVHVSEVGGERVCILQIVRQPWKYMEFAGILMLLCGCMLLFLQGTGQRKAQDMALRTDDKGGRDLCA